MTFLKQANKNKRLEIQFQAFLETMHLELVSKALDISSFILPKAEYEFLLLNIPIKLRLGNRLEHFFEFVINSSIEYKLLHKNIQIIKDKITIGELDFIVQHKPTNKNFHIEIANKFYLYDSAIEIENNRWIGPNRNDSLVKKIDKLKTKQFPLLYRSESMEKFKKLHFDIENIEQNILFKTQLFLPLEIYSARKLDNNIEGYYINQSFFIKENFQACEFFLPEKQDWQVNPRHCENWFSFEDIVSNIFMFLNENKSPLVWLKKENHFEKFFIIWW